MADLEHLLLLQGNLQEALDDSGLSAQCPSNFNYPKMHDLTHHLASIMIFEDPSMASAEIGELLNRLLIKKFYNAGNRHEDHGFVSILSEAKQKQLLNFFPLIPS